MFLFYFDLHNAEKKLKGGTLWDFSTSILSQNSKKKKRGPFGEKISEKGLAIPKKNWKPLISSGFVCYAGSVPWAYNGNLKFCRTFGRTILVTSSVSKKKLKNTDEKPRL